MLSLHLIAFAQTCFLPGFTILYLLYRKHLQLETMFTFSFALSLIFNYILVFILAFVGIFVRPAVLGVVLLEVVVLFLLVLLRRRSGLSPVRPFVEYCAALRPSFSNDAASHGWVERGITVVALLCLLRLLLMAFHNVGNIFQGWDAVVSWNRWAVAFAQNAVPTDSFHYPLLIPANWSLTYVITGTTWQFLPRAIMPGFLILMVLTQLLMGLRHRNSAYSIAGIIFSFVFTKFRWTDGFVDLPVAFFSWAAIFCVMQATEQGIPRDKANRLVLLGTLFALGSGVTKQSGLFMVVSYPLVLLLLDPQNTIVPKDRVLRFIITYVLLAVAIDAPFYVFAEYNIAHSKNSSEIAYVIGNLSLHSGRTYLARIVPSLRDYAGLFRGAYFFLPLSCAVIYACWHRAQRVLALTIFLPYWLLWAVLFSYDTRNAALSVPIFAMLAGDGMDRLIAKLKTAPQLKKGLRSRTKYAALVICGVLAGGGLFFAEGHFNKEQIGKKHLEKEERIGVSDLDKSMYDYFEHNGISGMVLTDYQYFGFLPVLSEHYRHMFSTDSDSIEKLKAADVSFILLTPYDTGDPNRARLFQYIDDQISKGIFREVLSYNDGEFRLVKLR